MKKGNDKKRKLAFKIAIFAVVSCALLCCAGCSRRDQVVITQESHIIDYVPEEMLEEDLSTFEGRTPLLPEYFDAYQAHAEEYMISRGDVLEISIFSNPDSSVSEAVIAPDGRLYYMFLEGIQAEGLTVKELSEELERLLVDMFVDPEVTVLPKHVASQSYMINGKIGRAGVYPITNAITLQQAIGEAGGISLGGYAGTTMNIANLRDSFVVRNGEKLDLDFERLLYTDGTDQNIFVRPGDYIYIASSLVQEVYLLGAVREQKPVPYKDGLTLIAALSGSAGMTGGTNSQADAERVLIVRGSLENPRVIQADIIEILEGRARDIYLVPGDLVYVQNNKVRFGRELVRTAINSFVGAFGSSAGSHYGSVHWFPNDR